MSLPNFMCIGAAKSGTTSLYDILKQHSDIFLPSFKEPHFFDIPSVYQNGIEWYEKTYFQSVKNEKCIGDFSPTYLFDEHAPERILNDLGDNVKFIIILRNPVDRAYSHYLHSKRDEHENLSFKDALSLEKNRVYCKKGRGDFFTDYYEMNIPSCCASLQLSLIWDMFFFIIFFTQYYGELPP